MLIFTRRPEIISQSTLVWRITDSLFKNKDYCPVVIYSARTKDLYFLPWHAFQRLIERVRSLIVVQKIRVQKSQRPQSKALLSNKRLSLSEVKRKMLYIENLRHRPSSAANSIFVVTVRSVSVPRSFNTCNYFFHSVLLENFCMEFLSLWVARKLDNWRKNKLIFSSFST